MLLTARHHDFHFHLVLMDVQLVLKQNHLICKLTIILYLVIYIAVPSLTKHSDAMIYLFKYKA